MYESHMGANVFELLQKEADEWQFSNRDIVLATDNTSNMAVATQLRDFVHVRCYAHTLNLACQWALKLLALSRLLGRIRRITSFFPQDHCHKPAQWEAKTARSAMSQAHKRCKQQVKQYLWDGRQPAIYATLLSPQDSLTCVLSVREMSLTQRM